MRSTRCGACGPARRCAHTVTLVVLGADLEVLGRDVTGADHRFQFLGPDRLIGTGAGGRTSSWRVMAGRLDLDADKVLDGTVWFPYPAGPIKLVPNQDPSSSVWLDPATLDPVEEPKKTEVPLVTLPADTHAVFRVNGGIEMRDLRLGSAAQPLGRPLGDLGPADLGPVTNAAAGVPAGSSSAAAVDLLLACLHYRVGTEIGIGQVRTSAGEPDDIALGGTQQSAETG